MTVLVFGKTGQVATELGRCDGTLCLSREDADLAHPKTCSDAIQTYRPSAVINAAAYTNVEQAESGEPHAMAVNATAPGAIAKTCAALDIPLVHLSTDYVFDGSKLTPWTPQDHIAPLNAYGRTKAAGEGLIRAADGPHVILRTSWVVSAHGTNFVKTIRTLGATRDTLTVVNDQIGGLTPARSIAQACLAVARALIDAPEKSGTYHFSGTPDASWADIARAVLVASGETCDVINGQTPKDPARAKRPLNSRLDCTSFQEMFTISRPDWRSGLTDILAELG